MGFRLFSFWSVRKLGLLSGCGLLTHLIPKEAKDGLYHRTDRWAVQGGCGQGAFARDHRSGLSVDRASLARAELDTGRHPARFLAPGPARQHRLFGRVAVDRHDFLRSSLL